MRWFTTVTLRGSTRLTTRTPAYIQSIAWIKPGHRSNSTGSNISNTDVVNQLQSDLKTALKLKNAFSATTIRSVLAEIYAAQKQSAPTLKTAEVLSIIRKAKQRRLDAMRQFQNASRADLAQHEEREAVLLASYLPPTLSIAGIDDVLRPIIAKTLAREDIRKAKGLALKAFYGQVDKNEVDGEVVKQRLDKLWNG